MSIYQDILKSLQTESRAQVKLSPELIQSLKDHWKFHLESSDIEALTPILCILDYTITLSSEFDQLFNQSFKIIKDPNTLIYLLAASSKHVIDQKFRQGNRLDLDFINAIGSLLEHQHPEVLEWTLRTIDQMGPQAIMLKEVIISKKPGIFAIFNKHKKASSQIIEMLEKRWSPR